MALCSFCSGMDIYVVLHTKYPPQKIIHQLSWSNSGFVIPNSNDAAQIRIPDDAFLMPALPIFVNVHTEASSNVATVETRICISHHNFPLAC